VLLRMMCYKPTQQADSPGQKTISHIAMYNDKQFQKILDHKEPLHYRLNKYNRIGEACLQFPALQLGLHNQNQKRRWV